MTLKRKYVGSDKAATEKCTRWILLLVVGLSIVPFVPTRANAQAPWSSVVWMRFSDNVLSDDTESVYFGDGYGATYCIDSLNPTIQEFEAPPTAPGFWIVFKDFRRVGCYGQGLMRYDFYGFAGRTQVDTFDIGFANYVAPSATWLIRWPSAEYLRARCDSIFIVEPTGKMKPPKVDMMVQDSLVLAAPGDSGIKSFYIIKYGSVIVDGVRQRASTLPAQPVLNQNYPNPFNPSTRISYNVPFESDVTLKIYDLLGGEMATLVNEKKRPGEYSLQWNAEGMPSGVYFYRMQARQTDGGQAGAFSVTRKLLLMK